MGADILGTNGDTTAARHEKSGLSILAICRVSDMGFTVKAYTPEPGYPDMHLFVLEGSPESKCETRAWKAIRKAEDWFFSGKTRALGHPSRVLLGENLSSGELAAFICHREQTLLVTSAKSKEAAEAKGLALVSQFKALQED